MLKLKNVVKSFYGNYKPTINGINLNLNAGEFCVIIGANGSGKSTLMKLINGDHTLDSGEILLEGKISQVVQDVNNGTISEMTLLENLALSLMRNKSIKFSFYHSLESIILDKIKELNLGFEEYINHPISNLSGGQRQIIALLMAVNSGSDILLLDEHTSALDPNLGKMLMKITQKYIKNLKLTCLMITHKLDDAIRYGDRLIMLHNGRIVLDFDQKQKSTLTIESLLALFHKYEDEEFIKGERNDN